jgi:hypothetical protein
MREMTPEEAALRGRIGGLRRSALYDGAEMTRRAREAFQEKFLEEVDPDRILSETERHRRAEAARKAHYARLALAAARAKTKKSRRRAAGKVEAPTDECALETTS